MNPVLLAALINQIAIPELLRWMATLHAENKLVTEAEAIDKLGRDVTVGDAQALAFLASHPPAA